MNSTTNTNINAVVRFVYTTVIALTLVSASAFAADKKAPEKKAKASTTTAPAKASAKTPTAATPGSAPNTSGGGYIDPYSHCTGQADYTKCVSDIEAAKSRGATCTAQEDRLRENMKEMGQVCSIDEKSLGVKKDEDGKPISKPINKQCAQKYKDCIGSPTTPVEGTQVLAKLFGQSSQEVRKNCDLKASDYNQQKRDAKSDIKALGKEIKDYEDEDAKVDSDYQKEIKDLQEAFAAEQKSLDDLQEDIDNKNMEEERAALDEDQKAAKNLSQLIQTKMELRNDLSTATVKAQAAMLEASDEISRGDCIRQVKKFKAENPISKNAKSAGDLIGGANSLRKQLEARFDACMEIMYIRRQEISRELSEKVAAISFKLDETAKQIQQLEDFNKQSTEQRAKRAQLMVDKKEKAIKASIQKTQQIQAELNQAGEMAKKKHASIKKALMDTSQARNLANADLIGLGAENRSLSGSDKSTREVIRTYNTYVENFKEYGDSQCCPNGSLCSSAKNIGASGKLDGTK